MLHKSTTLHGFKISATDGELGDVDQLYFDDQNWTVRYVVVDTGKWLPGRRVLISPASVEKVGSSRHELAVALTMEQIRNAPGTEADKPVSRQEEIALQRYYGWPAYWNLGTLYVPGAMGPANAAAMSPETIPTEGDPHLRSTREVIGYRIHASDGEIGHVEDFLVDDQNWVIRYMEVDTRNWLPGKKVLVAPNWIETVSWAERRVGVALTRENILNSPEYDSSKPLSREYETALHEHYDRARYW